jgi:hypothetical protein
MADVDRVLRIEARGERTAVEVGHHGSHHHDAVTRLHELTDNLIHQLACVHTNVGGALFVEDGLVGEHRGERKTGRVDEGLQFGAQTGSGGHESRQDARVLSGGDGRKNGLGRRPQHCRIAARRGDRLCAADDGLVGDIGREGHVDRPAVVERRRDEAFGLVCDVLRSHDRAGAHDRFGRLGEDVEFAGSQRVVNQGAARLGRNGRHTDQVKDREVLGIGARDAVQRAQFTDAVGRADCADAADSGVTVGGIGCIQLIAAPNPVDVRIVDDGIVHGKGVVPGDPEDIVNPNGFQASKDVLDHCFRHCNPPVSGRA